jgi:hypothetical protein
MTKPLSEPAPASCPPPSPAVLERSERAAQELARRLRRDGYQVDRRVAFAVVNCRPPRATPQATLVCAMDRPYIGVMDVQSIAGSGEGTRLVDALVGHARALGLRGLALCDASEGAQEARGFWRAYAAKRGLEVEAEELRKYDLAADQFARAAKAGVSAEQVRAAYALPLIELRILVKETP